MARGTRKAASEYDGTDKPNADAIIGPSIDPASIDGSGAGSPGSGDSGNGSGNGSGEFDPRIHVAPDKRNADGSYTRKRGRKAGSGSNGYSKAKKAPDLAASIEALSKTLVIVHSGLAAATGTPEMAIDEAEGKLLSEAAANVMQQFDLTPDPKTQAIIGMIMACGTVYGPRVYLIRARKEQERKEKAASANGSGMAGMYGPGGEPLGTTPFSTEKAN